MKKIECIIRSERLQDVTDALKKVGVGGLTVSEVRGFGAQNERPDNFLFVHKTKLEIYSSDSKANEVISKLLTYCSTGKMGDGKIAVLPLDDCIRIRTGERKNRAIAEKEGKNCFMSAKQKISIFALIFTVFSFVSAYATPTTLIWAPSTDIQPYKKIHFNADIYAPARGKDKNNQHLYVQQIYGPTFSLLSDKPEENLLGKAWLPLGKIMAETGFDYKKGFGSSLDNYPWYFNFKAGVAEDAYFKGMPAFAIGVYDMGIKSNKTNNNVGYFRGAKSINIGKMNLGRFSAGYFSGNGRLLRNKDGLRDNNGLMLAWERTMTEISDRLWLCVDYQGSQSSYGALNLGFSYKLTKNISAIVGFDMYNNRDLTDTITFQLDVDL